MYLAFALVAERKRADHTFEDLPPVAEKEEQQVEHQKEVDGDSDRILSD